MPRLDAVGAAIANSAAQVTLAVPLVMAAVRITGRPRLEAASLGRCALAATLAGAAALAATALGGIAGTVAAMLLFGVVFAVLAWALRVLPREDAVWLDEAIGARFRGLLGRVILAWASRSGV